MALSINYCFSCRFGWVSQDIGKSTACPNCHGLKTASTARLKDAERHVPRDVFEQLVASALRDPELRKANSEYMPLFWRLKKI